MQFDLGQKVKAKVGSRTERFGGASVLTITRVVNGGNTLYVTGVESGGRWVPASEVEYAVDESVGN